MEVRSLSGLTVEEIFQLIEPSGFKLSHAHSIANSIYKKRVNDIHDIRQIPNKLRNLLVERHGIGNFPPVASEISADRSVKYLFRSADGKMFETVYIPEGKRNTVCVSSQSGCRMGCSFCVTAGYGFHGNLSAAEIVNQVISIPCAGKVTHVVLMGMGEPMDNLQNVLKACEILRSEWGCSISRRNITVSTVGMTPEVEQFLANSECNVALSLFSPFHEERIKLVPAERIYPVKDILEMLRSFPVRKKRRLTVAYMMIRGLNDTGRHLESLISMLAGSDIRVNLLPYHKSSNDLNDPSSTERMMFFKHNLVMAGISASIRRSRGTDISAACGMLASGFK